MIRLCMIVLAASTLVGCSMTQEEMASLGQSMQQTSGSFNASSQQMLNASSGYRAPQAMPISPYGGGGNQVRCLNAGIYTNCR
jgi:uncharacterized protein YcfL